MILEMIKLNKRSNGYEETGEHSPLSYSCVIHVVLKVTNYGPSVVDWSEISITVPNLLKKDDPDSFLMYLLQVEVGDF